MEDQQNTTQQQNLAPIKKPSLWQRFKARFLAMSKMQKIILVVAVLVFIALAVFVFAGPGALINFFGTGNAELQIIPLGGPGDDQVATAQRVDAGIYLDTFGDDVVVTSVVLTYDPNYVNMGGFDTGAGVFDIDNQVTSNPVLLNISPGRVELILGRPGDGASGGAGFTGDGLVASFNFIAVNDMGANVDTEITFDVGTQVIQDDGQGTDILNQATGFIWTITPAFSAELQITSGPNAYVYQDVNDIWNAEITWTTNLPSASEVDTDIGPDGLAPGNVIDHMVTLTNLSVGTYNYNVTGDPGYGSTFPYSFIVAGTADPLALQIVNLSAESFYTSANITWNTIGGTNGGRADTQLSNCFAYSNPNPTLTHQVRATGLATNTFYTCTATSNDSSSSVSQDVSFTTLTGQAPDANVVLNVTRDRVCDKWLYCRSSLQVKNTKNKIENLCFDVGLCDEQNENGECIAVITDQDSYVRFSDLPYDSPDELSRIENISGLANVGVEWTDDGLIVPGYFHYVAMSTADQVDMNIPNGDFESGEPWPWGTDLMGGVAQINVVPDPQEKTNKVLKINVDNDLSAPWLNTQTYIGQLDSQDTYAITFSARTTSNSSQPKNLRVQFWMQDGVGAGYYEDNYAYYNIQVVPISNAWQTFVITSRDAGSGFGAGAGSGDSRLALGIPAVELGGDSIYIDNISMKSVLPVSSTENRARTCRLYPSDTAVACDYADISGKQYRGWKGFCVESDPNPNLGQQSSLSDTENMCLNWWPVDIISGETDVFGSDEQAGYAGRQPLYYCLEAAGNYSYKRDLGFTNGFRIENLPQPIAEGILYMRQQGFPFLPEGWGTDSGIYYFDSRGFGLREIDIERIVLTPNCGEGGVDSNCFSKRDNPNAVITLDRSNNWMGYLLTSGSLRIEPNTWQDILSNGYLNADSGSCPNSDDFFAINAMFNENGDFTTLRAGLCNRGGDTGYVGYKTTFYLREPCNVITQVITPNGKNTAWSHRVQGADNYSNWQQDNDLGYEYIQDYEPYGASVVPAPVSDPSQWENPLYVMPANTSFEFQEPYQVRAGSPYGDMRDVGIGGLDSAQCIAGSADMLGKQCDDSSDCGYNFGGEGGGLCMGINLTDNQRAIIGGGWPMGQERLSNLFARSYGVWRWQDDQYVEVSDDVDNGETFGWDITGEARFNDRIPRVTNIQVRDQGGDVEIVVVGPKGLKLSFNAEVDNDHLPMTAFRVNWDDGTPNSQVNNLRIYPRTNESDPHILTHVYSCEIGGVGWNGTACVYKPSIQVEDNWGWCNNGYGCSSDVSGWTEFDGQIVVYPPGSTPAVPNQMPVAVAQASPTSGTEPLTVSFTGSNSSDPDGSITSYAWDFGDGDTSTAENPTHTYDIANSYTATLTVTDNDGATASSGVTISVSGPLPGLTLTVTPTSRTITQGDPPAVYTITAQSVNGLAGRVNIFGTGTSCPGGGTSCVLNLGGECDLIANGSCSFTFTVSNTSNTPVGIYNWNIWASEIYSGTDSNTVPITLDVGSSANIPPAITTFTATPNSGSIPPDLDVNFDIVFNDPDSIVDLSYTIDFDDGSSTPPGTTAAQGLPGFTVPHTYTVVPAIRYYDAVLTVDDGNGGIITATARIDFPVGPDPLVAEAGLDQTVIVGGTVTLDAIGTTGGTVPYSFEWWDGPVGTLQLGAVRRIDVPLTVGSHTITLQVTDDNGLIDTDVVNVIVNPQVNGVLYYDFDVIDSGFMRDRNDPALNATVIGVTEVTGVLYGAFSFDGVGDYLDTGVYVDNAANRKLLLADGEIEFWFRLDDISQTAALISRDTSGLADDPGISLGGDGGHLSIYWNINDYRYCDVAGIGEICVRLQGESDTYSLTSNYNSWQVGEWYQLIFEFGERNGMRLCINDTNCTSDSDARLGISDAGVGMYLGASRVNYPSDPVHSWFDGAIDEFRIREIIYVAQGPSDTRVAGAEIQKLAEPVTKLSWWQKFKAFLQELVNLFKS